MRKIRIFPFILKLHSMEKLTIETLVKEAKIFCSNPDAFIIEELYGVTDGKAVGTFVEHSFKEHLKEKYELETGSSASGIDLPDAHINTDIKVTSIRQPQSSSPFKYAKQKIYGLGYNLLVFVYNKKDNAETKHAHLDIVSCSFIPKERTADSSITAALRKMVDGGADVKAIAEYLVARDIPTDEGSINALAEEIKKNKPEQGYLTISNALQWRLQYQRIVDLHENKDDIIKIV